MERGIPALADYFTGDDQPDELAFLRAVMELSQREDASKDDSASKSVSVSQFISNTVERFERQREKTEEKLEKLRREKEDLESSHIRDRPAINPKSKRLLTAPFQQRIEAEVQRRQCNRARMEREMKRQAQEENTRECTFKPKVQSGRSQSPCFVDRAYGWLERRNKTIAKEQEERGREELRECKEKPTISDKSEKLSRTVKERKKNGTFRGDLSPEPATFRPQLTPNSVKLAEATRPVGPAYLHLYSPSGKSTPPSTGTRSTANQSVSGRPLPKPPVRIPYSVNSSVRTATPPPVTDLSFDSSLSFLLRDII